MRIRDTQHKVHNLARTKGWWGLEGSAPSPDELTITAVAARLALIHSEVSEAVECLRNGEIRFDTEANGKPVGLSTELADIMIRTMDLATALGIDLEVEIARKHEYNKTRSHRHGGKAL